MRRSVIKRRLMTKMIIFCMLTNSMFCLSKYVWEKVQLQSSTFIYNKSTMELKNRVFVMKIINSDKLFWKSFWQIVRNSMGSDNVFFKELDLTGLGYRIKRISAGIYRFFWGYANYIYLVIPDSIFAEYFAEERRIILFSKNSVTVSAIVNYFFFLKKPSVYRIVGFVIPDQIIRLKLGKQR